MNERDRVHDWRRLKWPFTATFLYYALISLFTGYAEPGAESFAAVLFLVLAVDALVYCVYCFFVSRDREDMEKLWFLFVLAYVILTIPQLGLLWELLQTHAVT